MEREDVGDPPLTKSAAWWLLVEPGIPRFASHRIFLFSLIPGLDKPTHPARQIQQPPHFPPYHRSPWHHTIPPKITTTSPPASTACRGRSFILPPTTRHAICLLPPCPSRIRPQIRRCCHRRHSSSQRLSTRRITIGKMSALVIWPLLLLRRRDWSAAPSLLPPTPSPTSSYNSFSSSSSSQKPLNRQRNLIRLCI